MVLVDLMNAFGMDLAEPRPRRTAGRRRTAP